MTEKLSRYETKIVWTIVLFYCFYTQFFSSSFLINISAYKDMVIVANLVICIMFVPYAIKSHKDTISKHVWFLCLLFVFALIWGWAYWGESVYYGLKNLFKAQGAFTLFFYFILKKYKVSYNAVLKSILCIAMLYSFCNVIGILTYPDQLFGATLNFDDTFFEKSLEDRGVLRLFMQGADFIILAIFFVLLNYKNKKIYYLFLIPLFVMLIVRGTRTPLIVASLICLVYYLKSLKSKFLAVSIFVFAVLFFNIVNEALLNSNSDNPIVKYVQLTNNQIESNQDKGKKDIRVQMATYMLTELNEGNLVCSLIGNGIPGMGAYNAKLTRLENNNSFWVVDVGFIVIFVYFGVVGLILYTWLLIAVIKIKVNPKYQFAKFYIYYLYLILPTNCSLITLSSFMVAIALYLVYLGNKEYNKQKILCKID